MLTPLAMVYISSSANVKRLYLRRTLPTNKTWEFLKLEVGESIEFLGVNARVKNFHSRNSRETFGTKEGYAAPWGGSRQVSCSVASKPSRREKYGDGQRASQAANKKENSLSRASQLRASERVLSRSKFSVTCQSLSKVSSKSSC